MVQINNPNYVTTSCQILMWKQHLVNQMNQLGLMSQVIHGTHPKHAYTFYHHETLMAYLQ